MLQAFDRCKKSLSIKFNQTAASNHGKWPFTDTISLERHRQNPEFRNNPENFHLCTTISHSIVLAMLCTD